jgi:spermidine synthase
MGAVSVVEDAQGVRTLHINNREQEGSSATPFSDGRQAWVPVALHPAPRSALFLGLGTGITASAAAEDPDLNVDVVELLPEVIDAAAFFAPPEASASNPMPHVMAADARRYVRSSTARYDVIIADLFHPARSGSGSLYTVEHFTAVRERLAAGGLFCQWLPLHQLDPDSLRSIVRSFLAASPEGAAVLASHSLDTPLLGLIARREGGPVAQSIGQSPPRDPIVSGQAVDRRQAIRAGLQLDDELAVLGSIVAGPDALAGFSAGAPYNTDDQPVVAHRAPRLAYAADSQPRERLIRLLREFKTEPAEVLGFASDAATARLHRRLAAYWTARTRYMEAGMTVQPSADVSLMLAQVQAPLLDVLRTSPDFRPAYDPLLKMAVVLARVDPAAASELLRALQQIQPSRPDAALALQQLALDGVKAGTEG